MSPDERLRRRPAGENWVSEKELRHPRLAYNRTAAKIFRISILHIVKFQIEVRCAGPHPREGHHNENDPSAARVLRCHPLRSARVRPGLSEKRRFAEPRGQ